MAGDFDYDDSGVWRILSDYIPRKKFWISMYFLWGYDCIINSFGHYQHILDG